MSIEFEWDPEKARTNSHKHGIRFADAQTVFSDDRALTIQDSFPFEQRFVLVGEDAIGRVLVVVFTWQDGRIRLISARKATGRERQQYKGEQ